MPLYEYECGSCGHRFERIQKFSDPPEKTCPKCGGELHKLVGAPAMKFKGSGWYVTDYAGKGKESKAKKESKEGTDGAAKTEGAEKKADSVATETKTSTDSSTSTPKKDSKS